MTQDTIFRNYFPDKNEFLVVGIVGICIYSLIGFLAIYLLLFRIKNKTSKKFFALIVGMCCCELPRYYNMTIYQDYASTLTYGIHLMGASFFFAAFSIVCYQWSGLLELGSYSRAIYSKPALLTINAIFCINDIINSLLCILSDNLLDYFVSTSYGIYVMVEGVRNLIFSSFLSYYGLRLIRRFYHFSIIDSRSKQVNNDNKGCFRWFYELLVKSESSSVFSTAVVRLTVVLCIATCCFLLRVVMLILKLVALHVSSFHITSSYFPLFGLCWFILCDFIPRALPTISFMILMTSNKAKMTSNSGSFAVTQIRPSSQYSDPGQRASSWGMFMSSMGFQTSSSGENSNRYKPAPTHHYARDEQYSVAVNDEDDDRHEHDTSGLWLEEDDVKPRESSSVWRAIIGYRHHSNTQSHPEHHQVVPNEELSYSISQQSDASQLSMLDHYTAAFIGGGGHQHQYETSSSTPAHYDGLIEPLLPDPTITIQSNSQ